MHIPRTAKEVSSDRRIPFYEQLYLSEIERLKMKNLKHIKYHQKINFGFSKIAIATRPETVKPNFTTEHNIKLPKMAKNKNVWNIKTLREDLRKGKEQPAQKSVLAVDVN